MEYAMTRKALGIAALAAAFATAALQMAQAELTPEAARQVLAGVEGAVVSVRIQSRTIMTMEGRESSREESESEATGCVVNAKGLTAVSLSAVDPGSLYSDLMKSTGGDDGFDIRTEVTDIKLRLPDGKEVAAEIAMRDRDLDLAFVSPKTPLAAPAAFVDLAAGPEAQILDQVVLVWRLGKQSSWATVAQRRDIAGVLTRPRKMYLMMDAVYMGSQEQLGCLALGAEGKALGMQLLRKMPGAGKDRPQMLLVIIPAKEIAAIAKQVESGAIPADKAAEKPAPDSTATEPKAPAN